jgi:hypothetical protein
MSYGYSSGGRMQNTSRYNDDKLGMVPSVIPNSIKFARPKQGPPGTRKEFRFNPDTTSYASNTNNIVRFRFNNDGLIDFSRGFFAFDLSLTGGTGTYARVSQGIWSIVNRVRLTTGNELEDMREYGRLHNLLWETHRDPEVGSVLGEVYGYGTQSQRNTWGATPTKDYAMPLLCGFFLTGPIPMGLFNQMLTLELYLEDPLRCIETDSPTPVVFTLTNVYFHYEVLHLENAAASSLAAAAAAGIRYDKKKV